MAASGTSSVPEVERSPAQAGDGTGAPRPARHRLGSRSAWVLGVCCVSQFMVILDLSIVNVALPSIQSSLKFTSPDLQWVVDAYAITFAGFLMFGGRAADHFGQRRTFVVALALFGLASLAGGAASDRTMLIVARGVQGLGGALMAACSLAIITSSFPAGPQRHRAIGIWAAMNGAGGSAGVLFGGIITQEISWRWVLLINPPIAIATALVAYAVVSECRATGDRPNFDIAGAVTLTLGQMVLVYGVVKGGVDGWGSTIALGPIIGGVALLGVFGLIEARFASAPLIPFKELTKPVQIANNIVILFSAALFPMWFVSSLYLQQVLGLSPLRTGLTFLPMTLVIFFCASRAGPLVTRFGVRAVLGGGLLMLTTGMLLLARIGSSGSAIGFVMLPGLLAAAGIALSIVPSTIAATQGAKEGQAGLVSGLVNTSRQIGGGLGIALLSTLATQHTTHLIGAGKGVPEALASGFRLAYLVGAGLAGAAALITFFAVPKTTGPAKRRIQVSLAVGTIVGGFVALDFAVAGGPGAPIGKYTTKDTYSFVSEPALHPPLIRPDFKTVTDKLAPGFILVANSYDLNYPPMVGQSGPLILDSGLHPVWFRAVPEKLLANNLSLQSYRGRPALTWWQGVVTNTGQTLSGEDVVVDQHYRTVATLKGADGWILTLHSLLINGDHAWVSANKNITMDLSRYGGAYNGVVVDSAVQEYDLRTGRLLRTWDALRHIPLSESIATVPTNGFPWDAYHVNAIDLTGNGGFVVSMRNTWAAYHVDSADRIQWTLGGRQSSFKFGPGAAFEWQHDVNLRADGTVSLFDDHCCQLTGGGTVVPPNAPSRGLVLKLDQAARTASLVSAYPRGNIDSQYMGNLQSLPNGNTFVGWGSQPFLSEYDSAGRFVLDGEFPRPNQSYRASLERWVGLPGYQPAATARASAGRTTVYASWNGATEVASWRVLAGQTAIASVPRSGFETAIPVPSGHPRLQVQALDSGRRVIGTSRPFGMSGGR